MSRQDPSSPYVAAATRAGAVLRREPVLFNGVVKHRWKVQNQPHGSYLDTAVFPTRKGAAKAFCKTLKIDVDEKEPTA